MFVIFVVDNNDYDVMLLIFDDSLGVLLFTMLAGQVDLMLFLSCLIMFDNIMFDYNDYDVMILIYII